MIAVIKVINRIRKFERTVKQFDACEYTIYICMYVYILMYNIHKHIHIRIHIYVYIYI